MEDLAKVALAIFGGTITLAIISVIVSPQAQTATVINSTSGALSNVIKAATSPVQSGASFGSPANVGGALSSLANAVNAVGSLSSSIGSLGF